ncbi:hypothetical protein [Halocatena pleomorpha]|uniref:Right-handed parallel beta-helix repeat-containing protein n=1 Tax=Halocatena pleomorpha TaxID=1785090 RepID=A0A3P3RB05_9EURY|nr:hypothetical protein [Halocatena pleomorpha]RRJ30149.1 hypothetical protein EIK79_11245 [Halocatena pleomorpha]
MSLSHEKPLEGYARNIGGSAGKGTHGGTAVQRPAGMPTRDDATDIVSTASGLKDAVGTDNAIVYIDDTITLQTTKPISIGSGVQLVGGFCDPTVPGRGPVIERDTYENTSNKTENPTFISRYNDNPPTLWGISMRGPNTDQEYFKPADLNDRVSTGIWSLDTSGTFEAIGCEFWGWTLAGIALGATNSETDADVIRCTFHSNLMAGYGYGIEQYNGHLWCDRSFYNRNRHGISGFGYPSESWVLTESVIGPDWISHAMDMHRLIQNRSAEWIDKQGYERDCGGEYIHVRDCTFMNTRSMLGGGVEGIVQRGISVEGDEVWGCDFWHPSRPVAPGDRDDAYRVEARDSWEKFDAHDNAFGGPNTGFGAPRATVPGETGTVELDHRWRTITLDDTYRDPVVFMKPVTERGTQPCHTRLRNVGSDSFDVRLEEWEYLNDAHVVEHASFIVLERGTYRASTGKQVVVGRTRTDTTFESVSFDSDFSDSPVVLSQSQTHNGSDAIVTRNSDVHSDGFAVRLQEEEGQDGGHALEAVGYIALERGTVELAGTTFEVGRTPNDVTHEWSQIRFQTARNDAPVFLADMQMFNGSDPCSIRYQNLNRTGVDVRIQEEQSGDDETAHTKEVVGYVVS